LKAHPGSRVLFLVVELCALTFRKDDISKRNIVATALFGDGAAGARDLGPRRHR
jgi:alkylresorcinol/alkylpyrone synthase